MGGGWLSIQVIPTCPRHLDNHGHTFYGTMSPSLTLMQQGHSFPVFPGALANVGVLVNPTLVIFSEVFCPQPPLIQMVI